ncbi:MAG: pyridoxamine 5'-phosphate oxidase [Acidimicrobiaceae bacterium]|nr:pyridoxamine 5'-phosphate oxidase [Acidimicrobiaceae bacterium]MYG54465.1 pyridoxamine 5'-phosphate oxidase [Acidimicrobiaceae bacterium]MYJ98943.1 pyridoxamine 5'-phosphate oxidase [Acidimicrobiaceae bacterium]
MMDMAAMREEFGRVGLDVSDVAEDPLTQFREWFDLWTNVNPYLADTMVLSTVDADGWPDARAVLLKGVDSRGFVFYTNRKSAKGVQLEANGRAALTMVWREIERQVRVVGEVSRVSESESDAYFASRPRGAQIGACASEQSAVLRSRAELEASVAELEERYPDEIPRPSHWGGYLVTPQCVEFWQGRPDRLHDRVRYRLETDSWIVERLAP